MQQDMRLYYNECFVKLNKFFYIGNLLWGLCHNEQISGRERKHLVYTECISTVGKHEIMSLNFSNNTEN